MATATQRPANNTTTEKPAKSLLEQVIEQSGNDKVRQVNAYLTDEARIAAIEEALPDFMKGQARRLVKRAVMTFADKEALQKCTPQSFVKCVQQAAELGFAIDGRLCHAVPYNTKQKINGNDVWFDVAQLQVDYKGMIACTKRLNLVQDVWARLVYENDDFSTQEQDGKVTYYHSFDPSAKDRGKIIGSYAVATHKDGWFRFEWMSLAEIDAIRIRSKSYQTHLAKGYQTPWVTDEGEMRKKTVTKRLLKTFTDDPGLIRMLELDDQDIDLNTVIQETERQRGVTREALVTRIKPRTVPLESEADEPEQTVDATHEPTQPSEPHAMSLVDQFRAECEECELVGSVDLVIEKWLGEGSSVEITPDEAERMEGIASQKRNQLRDLRGKK